MQHTPRRLFAMLQAGERTEALSSNTFWMCVSCYHCVVRCPQDISITDVMYTLKCMAVEEGRFRSATAPDFSQTFVDMVENYGRSFELGLASIHYLKHFPLRLPSLTPMAVGLLTRKRMALTPKRIDTCDSCRPSCSAPRNWRRPNERLSALSRLFDGGQRPGLLTSRCGPSPDRSVCT